MDELSLMRAVFSPGNLFLLESYRKKKKREINIYIYNKRDKKKRNILKKRSIYARFLHLHLIISKMTR